VCIREIFEIHDYNRSKDPFAFSKFLIVTKHHTANVSRIRENPDFETQKQTYDAKMLTAHILKWLF
jgi:hypothetical protein